MVSFAPLLTLGFLCTATSTTSPVGCLYGHLLHVWEEKSHFDVFAYHRTLVREAVQEDGLITRKNHMRYTQERVGCSVEETRAAAAAQGS